MEDELKGNYSPGNKFKIDWSKYFRGDGTRGQCPKCNKMFDINSNQTFKGALILHYTNNHKKDLYKAVDYADKLYKESK